MLIELVFDFACYSVYVGMCSRKLAVAVY